MPEENVELVRSLYPAEGIEMVRLMEDIEAFRRTYQRFFHPEFEISFDPAMPGIAGIEGTSGSGIEAVIRGWREWVSAFQAYRLIPTEFVDLPDGRVLVLAEMRARSKTGEVEMAFEGAAIWTLEGGRVRKLEQFVDRERALEAAGLSE